MPDAVAAAPAAGTAPPAISGTEPADTKAVGVAAPALATEVAKEAPKSDAPKYKVKIDGVEKEVTLDELQKGYQLESAARKRMQEASEVLSAFEKNPREAIDRVLKDKKTSLRDLAIQVLSEEHQAILDEERRKSLDPKERETEDKLRELEQIKAERKTQEETQRTERVQAAKQQLSKAVIDTMQEFPESVRRNEALAQNVFEAWAYCVQHPEEAKELGIEMSPKGIAKALRTRQRELAKAMMKEIADAKAQEQEDLTEEELAVLETLLQRAAIKKKAAAEKAAHPSLTNAPQVRGVAKRGDGPVRKQGAKLRELTLGSLGIK